MRNVGRNLLSCMLLPGLAAAQEPIRLTLKRAVEVALSPEGNTRIQLAAEGVKQAEARSAQARAALLPDLSAAISEQSVTRNLEAFGLRLQTPIPGFQFPTLVGPFNIFDARLTAGQNVFDWSAIRRYQASRTGIGAARAESDSARDQVAAQVARAYIAGLRSDADLEAARANVQLAEAILKWAESQKAVGTGTGIEMTRARVQLSNERQRLILTENERRRALLNLRRAMNLRLDAPIELADRLEFAPVPAALLERARSSSIDARADLKAQREREAATKISSNATAWERLPSLSGFADYGSIGTGLNNALPTRAYGLALRVPVFDGGRRDARRAESRSQAHQEQIRTRDLEEQSRLEIRLALDALDSSAEQVKVAEEGLQLAENELAQARRRYEAGVANSLEVTDAQTRLARARDNRIAALFLYAQARLDLGQAIGAVRDVL